MPPTIRATTVDRREIAARCLLALPEWFGRPESTAAYIADAGSLPMLAAYDEDAAVGFLSLRDVDGATAEIHVIGVLKTHHRRGLGRQLVEAAMAECRARGLSVLRVRTLGPSHPDRNYAATREFYRAVGFNPVREDLEVWGPGTPCLIMELAL